MLKANVFKLGECVTVESEGPVPSTEKPRGPVYTVKGMEKPRGIPQNLWVRFIQRGFARGTMRPDGVSRNAWDKAVASIISYNRRLGANKVADLIQAWAKERELMRWHDTNVASRQQKKA